MTATHQLEPAAWHRSRRGKHMYTNTWHRPALEVDTLVCQLYRSLRPRYTLN